MRPTGCLLPGFPDCRLRRAHGATRADRCPSSCRVRATRVARTGWPSVDRECLRGQGVAGDRQLAPVLARGPAIGLAQADPRALRTRFVDPDAVIGEDVAVGAD